MFKIGDLIVLSIQSGDTYAVVTGKNAITIIHDDRGHITPGLVDHSCYMRVWELAITGKQDVPDALYVPQQYPHIQDISDWFLPTNEENDASHKCTCSITQIMQSGCVCGGE